MLMTRTRWFLLAAALVLITPLTWADNVFYGGFEDSVGGDYDYNDLVFSLTGPGIVLNTSTGVFLPKPTLNNSGNVFWDNKSGDKPAATSNVGFCMYVGCQGSPALDSTDSYLATKSGASVEDVTFNVSGPVSGGVILHIAANHDLVGWYLLGHPTDIHWLNSSSSQTGSFSFTPTGAFGLVGDDLNTGKLFYANEADGGVDDPRGDHFAFFGDTSVPEPGSLVLFGTALIGVTVLLRRRKGTNQ